MCLKTLYRSYLCSFFTLTMYIQMWIWFVYLEYLRIMKEYFTWPCVLDSVGCIGSVSRFVQKITGNVHGEGKVMELCVTTIQPFGRSIGWTWSVIKNGNNMHFALKLNGKITNARPFWALYQMVLCLKSHYQIELKINLDSTPLSWNIPTLWLLILDMLVDVRMRVIIYCMNSL